MNKKNEEEAKEAKLESEAADSVKKAEAKSLH